MVDFTVLPEASPAPEVHPDTRAVRVRVPELDNGIKLFPFYFTDMRKGVTNTG